MDDPMVVTILTQYHISKGIKVFGQPRLNDALKKLKEIHERMVIYPNNPDESQNKTK